jgi:hypothetical protein
VQRTKYILILVNCSLKYFEGKININAHEKIVNKQNLGILIGSKEINGVTPNEIVMSASKRVLVSICEFFITV